MLNSLQNGRCSFIFITHLVDTSNAAVFTVKKFLFFSQFSLPYFTLTIHTNTLFLYNPGEKYSLLLRTTIPTIYTKNIFRTSNIFLIQATSRDQETIVRTDTVLISPFFLKVRTMIAGLTHNH